MQVREVREVRPDGEVPARQRILERKTNKNISEQKKLSILRRTLRYEKKNAKF
jgi:hypothetical protein